MKSPIVRSSVALAYPMTIFIEYMLLSRYLLNTAMHKTSALPFVMIGTITYVYITIFLYTAYVMVGMGHIANKEVEPQMLKAVNFFMKAKEKFLIISIVLNVCLISLTVYYYVSYDTNIIIFTVTEVIFSLVLIGCVNTQGLSIIKKEIDKRLKEKDGIKESQVSNEEDSESEVRKDIDGDSTC